MNFKKNVVLAKYTTFKIGGPAKLFVEIVDENELLNVFDWAKKKKEKILILGGGSNMLISDKGFDGVVVKVNNTEYEILKKHSDYIDIKCGAGIVLTKLALDLARDGIGGLEWAVGIPRATIGGAIRGNAGAFGTSMSKLVKNVECFLVREKKFKVFSNQKCEFVYRGSIFKSNKDILIWATVLRLKKRNKDIAKKEIDEKILYRRRHHPTMPSAGSVFKNTATIQKIRKHSSQLADYIVKNGIVNDNGIVATGFLVEELGLKGKKIGGAKISEEHGNFIINTGNATAEDVIILMSLIKQKVRDKFGVQLEEEIQLVGF